MRSFSSLATSFTIVALSFSALVQAGIPVTITNRCNHDLAPIASYINGGISYVGDAKGAGGQWTFEVPDDWVSGRIYGSPSDGSCPYPDGPGCTLMECTFQTGADDFCNISNVSGYKDPMTFDWSCGSTTCNSATCVEAYLPDMVGRNPCDGGIKACTSSFLNVYFC